MATNQSVGEREWHNWALLSSGVGGRLGRQLGARSAEAEARLCGGNSLGPATGSGLSSEGPTRRWRPNFGERRKFGIEFSLGQSAHTIGPPNWSVVAPSCWLRAATFNSHWCSMVAARRAKKTARLRGAH